MPQSGAPIPSRKYRLRLYITGMAARSAAALAAIRALCDDRLSGRYELEVIDLYQHPALASADQIIATPTLVKRLPEPLRRLVGDLSNRQRVLAGLGLDERA
jgi:circadian clock protein KaiB